MPRGSALLDPGGPPNGTEARGRDPNACHARGLRGARRRYADPVGETGTSQADGDGRPAVSDLQAASSPDGSDPRAGSLPPQGRDIAAQDGNGSLAGGPLESHDPLLAALQAENERLRVANRLLVDQLAAANTAQEILAKHLRVTAPLRRVQEARRMRAGERRRRATTRPAAQLDATSTAPPVAATARGSTSTALAITDDQAARHPLLARTRDWQAGGPLLPEPDLRPLSTGRAGRVLVVAHVYYPDLWPELADHILRIPGPVDLVLTLPQGRPEALADSIVAQFPDVRFEVVANRGRDMWPFVRVLELGLVGDHDAVLKLHTKASTHRIDGAAWRGRLLDSLCPSPDGIGLILELLRREPEVGMVAPAGAVLGREFWGSNGPMIDALAARAKVGAIDPERVWFPGGSMFWSRPAPLNRLRDVRLTLDDFEHEAVSLDGTTAHALERFVGALVADAGLTVIGADEVAGRLAEARAQDPSGGSHAG